MDNYNLSMIWTQSEFQVAQIINIIKENPNITKILLKGIGTEDLNALRNILKKAITSVQIPEVIPQ